MSANRILSVVCVAVLSAATCFAQAPAQSVKIAVVNVNKVFMECKIREREETALQDQIKKINGELAALKVEYEDLVKQAPLHNPGSPKRMEIDQKIYEVRANIELYSKLQTIELEERTVDLTRRIYDEIRVAIAGYAQRNGLTLVLKYDDGDVQSLDPTELRLHINSRQVLFFKSSLDITQQILDLMNQG